MKSEILHVKPVNVTTFPQQANWYRWAR